MPHCPAGCWAGCAGLGGLPSPARAAKPPSFFLCDLPRRISPLSPPPTPSHSRITNSAISDASPAPARHGTSCIQAGPFLSPSRIYLAIAAILSPAPPGLFHDLHIDPNELHRPSQSSRHTLNPTGARASEQGVRAISTIVLGGLPIRFPECRTIVANPSLSTPTHAVVVVRLVAVARARQFLLRNPRPTRTHATDHLPRCQVQASPPFLRPPLNHQPRPREKPPSHQRRSTSASSATEPLAEASTEADMSGHVCQILNPPSRLEGTGSRVETISPMDSEDRTSSQRYTRGNNFFSSHKRPHADSFSTQTPKSDLSSA